MIQNIWSVLCESSASDKETGKVSLFNILESVSILPADGILPEGEITIPMACQIVSLWTRSDSEQPAVGKMRLMFCNPKDSCEKRIELEIDLSTVVFHHTRINMQGIKLNGPGIYKFLIELQLSPDESWVPVASIPLMVIYKAN